MIYTKRWRGLVEKKSRKRRLPATSGAKAKRVAVKPRLSEAEAGLKKASLFMNGRSQAVRLPKEFRFEGTHVFARKDGNRVILSPVDDRIERLIALMGSSPNFPEIPREPADPVRPEVKEYFGIPD